MPINAIGISLSGIRASSVRLTASAANIAHANATAPVAPAQPATPTANLPVVYRPVRAEVWSVPEGGVASRLVTTPVTAPGQSLIPDPSGRYTDIAAATAASGIDLTGELVEQLAAKIAFGANLAILRTASDLQGRLVDRWA